jgi:hypothetical protein
LDNAGLTYFPAFSAIFSHIMFPAFRSHGARADAGQSILHPEQFQ